MDFVTADLTPERFFVNLQLQSIIEKLQHIGYSLARKYDDFMIFENSNSCHVKIRIDGSINCTVPVIDNEEGLVQRLFKELTLIMKTLNPVYDNLLNINNIFLYWPDDYDFSNLIFSDYSVKNTNIYDGKYVSVLNRKVC